MTDLEFTRALTTTGQVLTYLIKSTSEKTRHDCLILIMSQNFLTRRLFNEWSRKIEASSSIRTSSCSIWIICSFLFWGDGPLKKYILSLKQTVRPWKWAVPNGNFICQGFWLLVSAGYTKYIPPSVLPVGTRINKEKWLQFIYGRMLMVKRFDRSQCIPSERFAVCRDLYYPVM